MIGIKPRVEIKVSLNQVGTQNWYPINETNATTTTTSPATCEDMNLHSQAQSGKTCVGVTVNNLHCYQCEGEQTTTTTTIANANNDTENKNLLSLDTYLIIAVIAGIVIIGGVYFIKVYKKTGSSRSDVFSS
jgi:hypothetical protein